jgi:hypothetical protein
MIIFLIEDFLISFTDPIQIQVIQDGAIQRSGEGESAGDEPAKET